MNKPLHRMGASAIALAIMCAGVSAPAGAQSARLISGHGHVSRRHCARADFEE